MLFRNLAKQLAALDVELAVKRSRWELELGGRVLPQPRVDRSLLVGHEALASSVVTHRLRQLRQRSFDPVNGVLVRQQRPLIGDQGVAAQGGGLSIGNRLQHISVVEQSRRRPVGG